jgi:CRISPR-associated protein Csb2
MPTIARYAIDGPVLPLVSTTLEVAEVMRRAIMSRYQRVKRVEKYGPNIPPDADRFASQLFSGKDERGQPLNSGHDHAFYLPSDEDGDGRIDHLTLYAPAGFNRAEIRAIDALRQLKSGDLELALLLVGLGEKESFGASPLFARSSVWISATPFLVTRHMKRRGTKRDPRAFFESPEGRVEFVKQVLLEELERRQLLQLGIVIEPLESVGKTPPLRPIQFRLSRQKNGDRGANRPRGFFRLRFPEPVSGPIALGHSCHFGLGLFVAEP